jgi:hypothetical protein
MTIRTLRERLAQRPFEPFRVVTSSGRSYEVRHPENAILLRDGLVVAYGRGNGDLPEDAAVLSLLHITAVERLTGRRRKRRR